MPIVFKTVFLMWIYVFFKTLEELLFIYLNVLRYLASVSQWYVSANICHEKKTISENFYKVYKKTAWYEIIMNKEKSRWNTKKKVTGNEVRRRQLKKEKLSDTKNMDWKIRSQITYLSNNAVTNLYICIETVTCLGSCIIKTFCKW